MTPLVRRILPSDSVNESHAAEKSSPKPYTVKLKAMMPRRINGASAEKKSYLRIVINETVDFVLISQTAVPFSMCVLSIIFDDSIELPATKVYEDASGFAVTKYNLALIRGPITCVTFNKREFKVGDKTTIYGLSRTKTESCAVESIVANIQSLKNTYDLGYFYSPLHMEVLHFGRRNNCSAGVLLDDSGKVEGLWLPFLLDEDDMTYVGVPLSNLMPALEKLQQGSLSSESRLLDVLLERVCKNDVTPFGVPGGMTPVAYYKSCRSSANLFLDLFNRYFVRVAEVSCCHRGLEVGDVILRHGDKSINKMSDLHAITHESLNLFVIRACTEIQVEVSTITMASRLVDRVV